VSGRGVDRIYGPFERARIDLELRGAHHPYVVADRAGRGWLSAFVRGAQHWDHSRFDALENPESMGRMLALDAIIHNEDRNTENMIFASKPDSELYQCWAIDMESALVSMPRALASKGIRAPRPHAIPHDLVVNAVIREAAVDAGRVAEGLSEAFVGDLVEVSTAVAGALDTEILRDVLVLRCRHAEQIVEHYLSQIERR